MPIKSILRRFSFRLRTALIVLTIGCVWLGWQANLVHQRRVVRNEIEAAGGMVLESDRPGTWPYHVPIGYNLVQIRPAQPVGWLRELMGDKAVAAILVRKEQMSVGALSTAVARFPEAKWVDPTGLFEKYQRGGSFVHAAFGGDRSKAAPATPQAAMPPNK
jgi:hypothetical protein